jgi:hypothetical protein
MSDYREAMRLKGMQATALNAARRQLELLRKRKALHDKRHEKYERQVQKKLELIARLETADWSEGNRL